MKKPCVPKELLEQLNEHSGSGYFLTVINERGEFEVFFHYDNPATELAMLNFLDIQSGANMDYIRQCAARDASRQGEEEDSD